MLHKVIIIAKFCFDYTVMCSHMPAKNTHLIFVTVLIAVIGVFLLQSAVSAGVFVCIYW